MTKSSEKGIRFSRFCCMWMPILTPEREQILPMRKSSAEFGIHIRHKKNMSGFVRQRPGLANAAHPRWLDSHLRRNLRFRLLIRHSHLLLV
jgi:uncharacterized protein VirK/YbjX